MKKIIFLIIPFLIFSCSEKKVEENKISETEKENNFTIWNHDWWIEIVWNKEKTWNETIKFIYKNEKNLIIDISKKEDLEKLSELKLFNWNSIILNIYSKDIFWKEILNYLNWANWEILNFILESEKIKDFKISNEEKEIFEKLNFKTKKIYINWKKYE